MSVHAQKRGEAFGAIAPSGHASYPVSMPIADPRSAIRKYLSNTAHFLTFRSYIIPALFRGQFEFLLEIIK
jgi:hypothetical protein